MEIKERILTMKKVLLLTIGIFYAQMSYTQNIVFYSEEFEIGVKSYLQMDASAVVSQEMADAITELDLSMQGIRDIRDIIYFQNVSRLNLSGNEISDISDLVNLSYLASLDISNNNLQNIDILNFTNSTSMLLNVALNYIDDFSMLEHNTLCLFTLVGKSQQRSMNEIIIQVGAFYSEVDIDGNANITYSVRSNQDYPIMLNVQGVTLQVLNTDNTLQEYSSDKPVERVERVTITMNGLGDTTYIVPTFTQQLSEGGRTSISLGLPEDYIVRPYHNRYSDAAVADGNKITYVTPNDFSGDTIYYEFRKDDQIKGYSLVYLSSNTTGINNVIDDAPVLYPNPAESYVVLKNAEGKQVQVHNSLGHKVFDKSGLSNEENVDISSWSPGLYFVVIYDDNRIVSSQKLIKK